MNTSVEELKVQLEAAEFELKTTQGIVQRLLYDRQIAEAAIRDLPLIIKEIKFERKQLKKAQDQQLKIAYELDAAEARDFVKNMLEKEKTGVKLKKGQFSEPILTKVNKLPEEVVNIIKEYLPIHVFNKLMFSTLTKLFVVSKTKPQIPADIKHAFIGLVCNQPETLRLLSYKQAHSIVADMSLYRFANYKNNTDLKNKIFMVLGLAMEKNVEFAYKMLKTVVVLSQANLRISQYGAIGKPITLAFFHSLCLNKQR